MSGPARTTQTNIQLPSRNAAYGGTQLANIQLPSVNAGCGGIDIFAARSRS
ncbi:MAG: conjugal transfer protein TraH [Rhodobacteraceae bacterium]|nr:conjugal transfer protein TraH [Paracoccaceae bacterium]